MEDVVDDILNNYTIKDIIIIITDKLFYSEINKVVFQFDKKVYMNVNELNII